MSQKRVYYKNFGTFLKGQYSQRKLKNESYSLRAFARFLEISPALLSDYINSKKDPQLKNKSRILKKLNIKDDQIKFFTQDVSKNLYKELSAAESNILYQWKSQLLLQATQLNDFKPDLKWLSQKLNLKVSDIKLTMKTLQENGYLEVSQNNDWIITLPEFVTNISAEASLKANISYQSEILSLAQGALEKHAWDKHEQKSMMFAIQSQDFEEIKERIHIFSRSLAAEFGTKSDVDAIYQLSLSFFPLSKI